MPKKTKIGTEVAHVTRDCMGHHFQGRKVKGQGHQAALLSAALTRKAAAAFSVATYSAWEINATLRLLGGARGAWAPTGEERGGHIVSPRAQLVIIIIKKYTKAKNNHQSMQFDRQTLVQQNGVETLHQRRATLKQETGLSSLLIISLKDVFVFFSVCLSVRSVTQNFDNKEVNSLFNLL